MKFGPDVEPTIRVLNLGAGVQSSTVLLMAVKGEFPRPDRAIFADTGWEPTGVYAWLDYIEGLAADAGIPVDRVSTGNIRTDVLGAMGGKSRVGQPPFYVRGKEDAPSKRGGRLWRKCTRDYKVDPINRRIRELLGAKPGRKVPAGRYAEQWYGISSDETQRMRTPRDAWAINWYPLVERGMSRASCLAWMERNDYPRPPRSACIGCPFHSNREWRAMKLDRPDEWADAVEFDKTIRTGLPGVAGEAYLHRTTVPLDQVDLTTIADHGQTDLFGNECEGMCGV